MFVDTHAHLDFDDFARDLPLVITRAYDAGVSHIISVGTTIETSMKNIALAKEYPHVYATVGVHPHDAKKDTAENVIQKVKQLLSEENVVALGEVGLDYYRDISPRQDQQALFRSFLSLHKECNLPLILHARDSYSDLFSMLKEELGSGPIRGVMHCFSGDENVLREALSFGLYVSFTGVVTFKKCDAMRELVQQVPDDRLLLETDCPFLAPQSQRGKRNEPALLRDIAECIADARGVSLEDLGRITSLNCQNLFGVPPVTTDPKIVYKIRNSLYINTTNKCTNVCRFCAKFDDDFVKGHNLKIEHDPNVPDVLRAIESYHEDFSEVVFCGFGEPFLRLDFIKEVAAVLKEKGIRVRIDTNGHGNRIHKRNVVSELDGLIDEICVSLNAPNAEQYNEICQPTLGGDTYGDVVSFIQAAKKIIPSVVVTFLDLPEVDVQAMKEKAAELGVAYRRRHYNKVG